MWVSERFRPFIRGLQSDVGLGEISTIQGVAVRCGHEQDCQKTFFQELHSDVGLNEKGVAVRCRFI